MSDAQLCFLHLSDIHFRADGFDLDEDLRNEIRRDVEKLHGSIGQIDGILVTGDIAYRGAVGEYELAGKWLQALCESAKCPSDSVWVVPGNHDVDWTAIENNRVLQGLQRDLRSAKEGELDEKLNGYAHDSMGADVMFRGPVADYNKFAARFGCTPEAPNFHWTYDMELNDGSKLVLRGVNSVLVSNRQDDQGKNRLIVGRYQLTAPTIDGVTNLLMCHHPPDWLVDEDSLHDIIVNRYPVQLFGHKHRQRVYRVGDSARVSSGAVHPSRNEAGWDPRYNALTLYVTEIGDNRRLHMNVWPRVWNPSEQKFVPEGTDGTAPAKSFELPLPPWKDRSSRTRAVGSDNNTSSLVVTTTGSKAASESVPMTRELTRQLVYRFYRLPYHARVDIGLRLNLIQDDDENLPDFARFDRMLKRAAESDRLKEFEDAVESKEAEI